jgi:UDP-glucose 4-epimerase
MFLLNPRVLITGISGFIGQYLCDRLQKEGYEVFGLYQDGTSTTKNELQDSHKYIADLRDEKSIGIVVKSIQPHFVIHLAAKTEVALSFDNYREVSEVNYIGTVVLAEACRKFCPNLKLFVMASTMETYGLHESEGAFDENTEQRPMAPYSVAKLACEKYLAYMSYAYNFPYTILRQTNTYGRTDNDFFIMERIITQMLWDDELNLGEPTPVRNFIYIDDLIDLYVTLLEKYEIAQNEVFCVGPDNGLTIEELAEKIASIMSWEGKIHWNHRKDGLGKLPGEIYYLNSSGAKAKTLLGWEPKISLDEGIKKTIDIWKDQIIVR